MSILIKNGQVIDPATQKDEISDVLIENGVITRVEKGICVKDAQVIDAKGCYVMPGMYISATRGRHIKKILKAVRKQQQKEA